MSKKQSYKLNNYKVCLNYLEKRLKDKQDDLVTLLTSTHKTGNDRIFIAGKMSGIKEALDILRFNQWKVESRQEELKNEKSNN
jgi:hypothetical protein